MKVTFEIASRKRTVEIRRATQGFAVTIDGRTRLVDAVRVGADVWSLLVRNEDGSGLRSVEAVVVPQNGNGGAVDVYIEGHRIPVVDANRFGRRAREGHGGGGTGPQRVTAPMPGKVVKVLVEPGAEVTARQGLVVVEAMKMENELRATRDGRVVEVLVREGQSVEAGTPLVVVE